MARCAYTLAAINGRRPFGAKMLICRRGGKPDVLKIHNCYLIVILKKFCTDHKMNQKVADVSGVL